ncbi:MAG: response regulator [Proteobacteria bacterium]|nr:response regulator [Pseudomonadota bacterium]
MTWLFPSIVATLVGTLILAIAYFYLYYLDRKPYLFIWAISWCIYAVRFVFMLMVVANISPDLKPGFLILNQLAVLVSGVFLLWGTYTFISEKLPPYLIYLSAFFSIWIIAAGLSGRTLISATLPIYIFLGGVYILTGIKFLKNRQVQGGGSRYIVGYAFIVWGIHKADYPFVRPVEWLAPWGYLLGASLEIIVAIGMILIYFQLARAELKKSKENLKISEERLRAIFRTIPDPVLVYDNNRFVSDINPQFTKVFGWTLDEIKGRPMPFVPDDQKAVTENIYRKLYESDNPVQFETRRLSKHGELLDLIISAAIMVDASGERSGMVVNLTDITGKKRLEAKLQDSQKMEAIGVLSGGVAHDFNNLLGIILGNTELALDDVPSGHQARLHLEEIQTASLRAKDVIKQLLSFSRKTEHRKKPVNIQPVIKEALQLMRASLPASIEIRTRITENVSIVLADLTQIHQVLINLCTNAAHAMEENGGVLEIQLGRFRVTAESAKKMVDFSPGEYVRLSVRDTGTGISPDIRDKVFDPYFTTKGVGKGTGIGLAVVKNIVKTHQGVIEMDSQEGQGTAVTIYLPLILSEAVEEPVKRKDVPGGNEKILFVDDEEPILNMAKRTLEQLGYYVEIQNNPLDALSLFQNVPQSFDLVITDMTMPGMDGSRFVTEIRTIRPSIPIILCTGFSEKMDEQKAESIGADRYIEKPFERLDIAMAIRNVLDDISKIN